MCSHTFTDNITRLVPGTGRKTPEKPEELLTQDLSAISVNEVFQKKMGHGNED